ncbi:MAG: S8 family serine peptidase [Trueperaceae bacterium]
MRTPRSFVPFCLLLLLLGGILVACSGGGTPSTTQDDAVVVTVDPSLDPSVGTLPPLGGQARPVAVLEDEDGTRASFVANELWLATDDRATLDAVLARWNGTVLVELDPAASGVTGLPRQYLIRIDATLADPSGLAGDLATLDGDGRGQARVSSDEALGLLAASAREAVDGSEVGINWIGEGAELSAQDVSDRDLTEAPSGPRMGGRDYEPNPYAWPTHDVGSPQDIGVAEAWRALDAAGRLDPGSVTVAILDMGFAPDADTPAGFTAVSNVPAAAPTGTENLLGCGGGPCPWHGTNVMSAAFALPGNGYGSAGPAGPIANAVLVFTLYDYFTSVSALIEARALGARIVNMSYRTPVPWYLSHTVLPFEAVTVAARASGMLLFAAAGNKGDNVDAEATLAGRGLGFESTWHTPCENAGVICVGGLAPSSLSRASNSNYGAEQVDLFAPFTLWLGPDPAAPDNVVRALSGTSFSSPFAAGVAALVWAADPTLSASDVEATLFASAKSSPDGRVGRVVDALGAVQATLGNVPPTVAMTRPTEGAELNLNATVFFDAIVSDFEDGVACCEVTWTSDVDGALGIGRAVTSTFTTVGARVITVTAVDSGGGRTSVATSVTVVNDPPRVNITNPLDGAEVFLGVSTVLRGTSFDVNEPDAELACDAMAWTSSDPSDDAFPLADCEVSVAFATLGSRTITLTGTDPQGASVTDTVIVVVVEPPLDLPPSVVITSPENLQSVGTDEEITLSGDVSDPEGATPLTLVWTVSVNDGAAEQVGTGNDVLWTPSDTIDFGSEGTYDVTIRLAAQDPGGNEGSDFVQLRFRIIN